MVEQANAYVLFNDREKLVDLTIDQLESHGIRIEFWADEQTPTHAVPRHTNWPILAFLGMSEWGTTHESIALSALNSDARLIPVLIATPPGGRGLKVFQHFQSFHAVDLTSAGTDGIQMLVTAIYAAQDLEQPNVELTSEFAEGSEARHVVTEDSVADDEDLLADDEQDTIRSFSESRFADDDSDIADSSEFELLIRKLVDGNESDRVVVVRWTHQHRQKVGKRLAKVLLREINLKYRSRPDDSPAKANRALAEVPAIRSWLTSCMIAADCEDVEVRNFVFEHLRPDSEKEPGIRYWVLSQVHYEKASYELEAARAALTDPEPAVSLTARALLSPDDSKLLEECRLRLSDRDYDVSWPVLRAVRTTPLPGLARDICSFLLRYKPSTPEAYDSLSSLCSPPMAIAAAPILSENPGLEPLLRRVLAETSQSDPVAANRFAVLLRAFPQSLHTLEQLIATEGSTVPSILLRRALRDLFPQNRGSVVIPTVTPDTIAIAHDYLDIAEDVQTLAAVMLAKDVPPPLAIGLFGDWGSGKSFFMRSLVKATEDLSARAQPKLCSRVASVWFNAWHYTDANLWASLVDTIFKGLAKYVSPEVSLEDKQAVLALKLGDAKVSLSLANEKVQRTLEQLETSAKQLEVAKKMREQRRVPLWELNADDLRDLAKDNDKLKAALRNVAEKTGVDEVAVTGAELESIAEDATTLSYRVIELMRSFQQSRNWLILVVLVALVLFGFPFLARWLQSVFKSQWLAQLGVLITESLTITGAVAGMAVPTLRRFKDAVSVFTQAKRQADVILARKTAAPSEQEERLHRQIESLKVEETQASDEVAHAATAVATLEADLKATQRARSLAHFLLEKSHSDAYQKHLGLISTIRADFEWLATRLANPIEEDEGLKSIDRIVLYIDDLDRCPEENVLAVLQAVHLLLAYPIFVVVVGVDPRWLVHSLKQKFSAFRTEEEQTEDPDGFSAATPQHYMEKIFQIPFSLKPMSKRGYATLIDALLASEGNSPTSASETTSRTSTGAGQDASSKPTIAKDELNRQRAEAGTETNTQPPIPPSETSQHSAQAPFEESTVLIHEDAMIIRSWETTFAESLYSLIPTPRAAKRFTNTYRILKAPLSQQQLSEFEGAEHAPGTFQIAMVLLALTIGFPTESRKLFDQLWLEATSNGEPGDIMLSAGSDGDDSGAHQPLARIRNILSADAFPQDREAYEFWLPRVSRFSFDLTPMIESGYAAEF